MRLSRLAILLMMLAVTTVRGQFAPHQEDSLAPGHRVDFIENKGQWNQRVRYRAITGYGMVYLEDSCFTIVVQKALPDPKRLGRNRFHHQQRHQWHAYRMTFEGANRQATIEGRGKSETYDNYFIGNDPSRWASHVNHYGSVRYNELYDGIDLRVFGTEKAFKYDLVVQPGADPAQIRLKYEGADRLRLKNGEVVIETSAGPITEHRPFAYQMKGEKQVEVQAEFRLKGNTATFELGNYDRSQPLIIDPYLHFSTYTGSYADNWGTTATYDSHKNTYTSGLVFVTDTCNYPISLGAYDPTYNGNADIGVFKFDTTGSQRLYATYLGGSLADMPHSMFVNTFDELIIFGTTGSANFPTSESAFCRTFNGGTEVGYLDPGGYYHNIYYPNGSDIFIARFSSDGTQLLASTYLGGSGNDGLNYRERYNSDYVTYMEGNDSLYYNYGDGARGEIITDDLNNVYLGTTTFSHDFPITSGAIQANNHGKQDGLVLKIDHNLSNLLWSTYLGGSGDDAVYSIDVDDKYNLVVCGGTNSSMNFPTTAGALHSSYLGGSADGFITKFSYNGDRMLASTLFGSNAYDQCYFVRCGKKNDVFIFGQTEASGSTLIHNANYNTPNSGNFLARLNPNMDSLVWSTVFGTGSGQPNISPTAFAADICNRVYVSGWGRDFVGYNAGTEWFSAGSYGMEVTTDAYQSETDGQDFYIMSLTNDASQLDYATFFGEVHDTTDGHYYWGDDHVDGGTSRFDRLATLYQSVCGGCSGSDNFPTTTGAWSETNNSDNCNNALFRININNDFPVAEFTSIPVGCAPYTVHFNNTGRGDGFLWDFGDGDTSTDINPVHTFDSSGLYTITLIASIPQGCSTSDTITGQVLVLGNGASVAASAMSCDGEPLQIGPRPMLGATYLWTQGQVSDSTIANPWVQEGGDYVLQITSTQGCSEQDTFNISFLELLDTLIVSNPSCPGNSDGSIVVVLNGAPSDSIQYYWNGIASSDSVLSNIGAGTYHLRIHDGLCEVERTIILTDPVLSELVKEASVSMCDDSCQGWIHLWWGTVDSLAENLCEGTYTTLLVDNNGCRISDTTTLVVQHSLDSFYAWADDTLIFLNLNARLHATTIPGVHYLWTPSSQLDNPYSPNPLATPEDTVAIYYVTATDSAGCQKTDSVKIHCIEVNCGEGNIFIPNLFSPNGDGVNDQLCFRGEYVKEFHIAIFTRWGELVWESDNIADCWDGRYKGNWCQPGVYVYTCKVKCEANEENTFKGDITIIR